MDEREENNLILNHPAYNNSFTKEMLWLRIYGEHFKRELIAVCNMPMKYFLERGKGR